MAHQTKVVMHLILAIAATALATPDEPLSDSYFDKLIQETQQRKVNDRCSRCCPFGWTEYSGRCFKYHSTRLTWSNAEKHCRDLGGNLISVHNINDYGMAKALVRSHDRIENPTWIGLSNCQKRVWFWSDGTSLTFTKWNPTEPNRLIGECCVHMNYGKYKDWNDVRCSKKYAFVCARRLYKK